MTTTAAFDALSFDSGSFADSSFLFEDTAQLTSNETFSGGFFFAFEQETARRRKRRKEMEEEEERAQQAQDALDRQIAAFMHEQMRKDEDRADIDRLKRLVRSADLKRSDESLNDRVRAALDRVMPTMISANQQADNYSAWEALYRELQRQLEEEEHAVMMLLLH